MEQKPALSFLFYCTLIILGAFFFWQGSRMLLISLQQGHRLALPATLNEFRFEAVPRPEGGIRNRLSACRYEYHFKGRTYQGQRFSLFENERYSRDLPVYHKKISKQPTVYIDPGFPMDAVLLIDPPQATLLTLLIGMLFIHWGGYSCLLWYLKKRDRQLIDEQWHGEQSLRPALSQTSAALLLLPTLALALCLLFSFALIPSILSSRSAALISLSLYVLFGIGAAVRILQQGRLIRRIPIVNASWTARTGLQFELSTQAQPIRAVLLVSQLRESRFSWRYQKTGQAEFEGGEALFTLAPYTFTAASPWHRPMSFFSSGVKAEWIRMQQESESLCQILAGQSSRHKGRSPLMGLIRKRPDHRLEICIRHGRKRLAYPLPVAFWTSEISR